MIKICRILLIVSLPLLTDNVTFAYSLIGSTSFTESVWERSPNPEAFRFALGYYDDIGEDFDFNTAIFQEYLLSESSVGNEYFVVSAGPDANDHLNRFAEKITNNQEDILATNFISLYGGEGRSFWPENIFGDLSGRDIVAFSLSPDFILIEDDGPGTRYYCELTVNVYADSTPVPILPSFLLFGSGLICLQGIRATRRTNYTR